MPRGYPELYGVSAVCAKCVGKCKQWKQVIVVECPNFKAYTQQSREKLTL